MTISRCASPASTRHGSVPVLVIETENVALTPAANDSASGVIASTSAGRRRSRRRPRCRSVGVVLGAGLRAARPAGRRRGLRRGRRVVAVAPTDHEPHDEQDDQQRDAEDDEPAHPVDAGGEASRLAHASSGRLDCDRLPPVPRRDHRRGRFARSRGRPRGAAHPLTERDVGPSTREAGCCGAAVPRPAARAGARVVRRARARPAVARRRPDRRGACWSARSCCSRRRWSGWSRRGARGWRAGRRLRTWPRPRPRTCCARGTGWATRAARCACRSARGRSSSGTAARSRRRRASC